MKTTSEPIAELGNRTWEELEIVEHPGDGTLLFRDKIRKRTKTGKVEEKPVRVRIVRPLQIVEARAEARIWFDSIKGLDAERDADTFGEMEQICILAHAIRDDKAPYGQLCTAEELARDYEEASLWDLKSRIEVLRMRMDPRIADLGPDEIWGTISAVAAKGHLGPLVDIAGHAHTSLVVFMAAQALRSPTGVAWLQSLGSSTQEPTSKIFDGSFVAAG